LGLVCSEELEETASTVISAKLSTFAAEVGLKQPDQGLHTPYVWMGKIACGYPFHARYSLL